MGLDPELPGRNATWAFLPDRIEIAYSSSSGIPRLLRRIGQRSVPLAAIARAAVMHGDGAPVLSLRLHPGADPYTEVAAGQLAEDSELYRLELDRGQSDLAEYYAEHIRLLTEQHATTWSESDGFLLGAEPPPLHLRCFDADAHLDADNLHLRWNADATPEKRAGGDRTYPLADLRDVEWVRPGAFSGQLSVRVKGESGDRPPAEEDPTTVLFGLGCGTVADSLPFGASLLAGMRRHAAPASSGALSGGRRTALDAGPQESRLATSVDEIANAIRELGSLKESGLLDDAEFQRKKQELLDRL
ncbi:hypothetical protein FB384_000500 [Prauserella sediminis]|uniref:Uncharacterized protein n=1 Tax=Prauserella sediminis TaxID=577680 RepID=A0A839XNR2_9PSEU|nr:DUF4429 domain-containing protein [Prauserella sediminis]MBB3661596.1 hypothetical protein [Prauserella sediminis]